MLAAKLDTVIKSVCPIHGVSIGRKDDKATWRIDFKDEATAQQRADAKAVLEAFDVAAAENTPIPQSLTRAERILIAKRIATREEIEAQQ